MNECRIALADDDEDDRAFFKESLEKTRDAKLLLASNGKELLDSMERMPALPSIIFLDLNMPLMDGHETLKAIRENKKYKEIPVVIYTTSSNPIHIERTYASGANLYVSKPTNYNKIQKMLTTIFSLDMNAFIPRPSRDKFVLNIE